MNSNSGSEIGCYDEITEQVKTMKTFIRVGMKKFLEENHSKKTSSEVKASEMWLFIKQCYPSLEQTKYRPSIIKSLWNAINEQFASVYTLKYDIKQGPALQHIKKQQQPLHKVSPPTSVQASSNRNSPETPKQIKPPQEINSPLSELVKMSHQNQQPIQFVMSQQKRTITETNSSQEFNAKRRKVEQQTNISNKNYNNSSSGSVNTTPVSHQRQMYHHQHHHHTVPNNWSSAVQHSDFSAGNASVHQHIVYPPITGVIPTTNEHFLPSLHLENNYFCIPTTVEYSVEARSEVPYMNEHFLDEIFRFLQ